MVYCRYISGSAGTGKSTLVRVMIEMNPRVAVLCATTGIASVNLGVSTLNSVLKYYDTEALRESYYSKRLMYRMLDLFNKDDMSVKGLAIDEVSLLDASQLDIIYKCMDSLPDMKEDLNLILVGDFCQLPVVNGRFAFEADIWPKFKENTDVLTEVYRQTNSLFLDCLNAVRSGMGRKALDLLKSCGVEFHNKIDLRFEGSTILPKNDMVDRFNDLRFIESSSLVIRVPNVKIGQQLSEWRRIPDVLELKKGSLVLILANNSVFDYANGDLGYVVDWSDSSKEFMVRLIRNDKVVPVGYVTRPNIEYVGVSKTRTQVGSITYMPLKLAYATSVHRSQGLSLDKVQVDINDRFFTTPGMLYVALSRVRTPEGLRIIGDEKKFVKRCTVDPRVVGYV